MRTFTALLALGAVASAQQAPLVEQVQDQLKGWYSQASSAVNSFAGVASSSAVSVKDSMPTNIPDAQAAANAAIASRHVQPLTVENFKSVLLADASTASPGTEEWMIYVTGGNKTCMGWCGRANDEWNKAVPALTAIKGAPHLASIDCENDGAVLCQAWAASPPSVLYLRVPHAAAGQSQPKSEIRYINLNRTSIEAETITGLYSEGGYKLAPVYEGMWHPLSGPFAETGLNIYIGYAIWAFSKVPSWLFMVSISMFSRTWMSRRAQPGHGARPAGGAPAAPAAR